MWRVFSHENLSLDRGLDHRVTRHFLSSLLFYGPDTLKISPVPSWYGDKRDMGTWLGLQASQFGNYLESLQIKLWKSFKYKKPRAVSPIVFHWK